MKAGIKLVFFVALLFSAGVSHADLGWDFYAQRYGVSSPNQRITDGSGRGFKSLAGTKNFRQVLTGVVYRGGGYNAPRSNVNPLPTYALNNLCSEGFENAIYLYSENFHSAPKSISCNSVRGRSNKLNYVHIPHREGIYQILKMAHQRLTNPEMGPMYVHCFNGWHATGQVAANILQQFCGWNSSKALDYWHATVDAADKHHTKYEGTRRRIREFKPYADLTIPASVQRQVCPF